MPITLNLPSERIRALFDAARVMTPAVGDHLDDADVVKYASGMLDVEQSALIEQHIANCPSCASDVESILLRLPPINAALTARSSTSVSDSAPSGISARDASHDPRAMQSRVRTLLQELGCIERDGDYALPNGLHADTHINVARLCGSEDALISIAESFLEVFRDVPFDTILAHGWTMGMIARRMASLLLDRADRAVQLAETEGYNPPTLVSGFAASPNVLVLADVFVTGGLIGDLRGLLERHGSRAIAFGVIAAYRPGSEFFGRIRPLCTLKFVVETPAQCSRCGILPLLEFNPVSCCMTNRRSAAKSPSEFLNEYPGSTLFWEAVEQAKACEHHHIERSTHHVAFVDVARVLGHSAASARMIGTLLQSLLKADPSVELFFVPQRKRAKMLADLLVAEGRRVAQREFRIVFAVQTSNGWTVDPRQVADLDGKSVFIVDSAVGRGATLDNLFLLCRRHNARTIGMVTIVSRLSEAHESALNALMGGRFVSGYRFPMRPLAVYRTPDLCPICARRRELADDASTTRASALHSLANRLQRRRGRTVATGRRVPVQLSLPDLVQRPLLERCSRSVAAAITLNALHASRNNGMAPLKLPEVRDLRIPAKNRAAMIESLPVGISKWSGIELLKDLEACLDDREVDTVWAAAATVLATEIGEQWIRIFKDKLRQAPHLWCTGTDATWDSIAYSIHQVAKRHYASREELHGYMREVYKSFPGTAPKSVVKVVEVTSPAEFDNMAALR